MLQLFNTLSKQKELFAPLDASNVGMYVCGPTVYDLAHLGNARPVVVFDLLFRLLQRQYPQVTYVRNITDIDDKINAAALANGEDIRELTTRTTRAYHQDMSALGALPPTHEPRATDHIAAMVNMIESLIEGEYAYAKAGHVLFRVQKYQAYGQLSRRQPDELIAGARVEIAPYKENPGDFVLWKPSTPELPGWDSPWGRGRPGWHIECSAMSKVFLGDSFDIHGGGIDLVFPHHENEIAQSCCAQGADKSEVKMARFWMHNGHLLVNGEKMSKSLGNFFTVRDVLKDYPGEAIRFAFLSTHYRQPLDWTDDSPKTAKASLDRFYKAIEYADDNADLDDLYRANDYDPTLPLEGLVISALEDDLNTPLAISHLHELSHLAFTEVGKRQIHAANMLKACGKFLGILTQVPKAWFQGGDDNQAIEQLVSDRYAAKQARNFVEADRIRALLIDQDIALEDGPNGTKWRRG